MVSFAHILHFHYHNYSHQCGSVAGFRIIHIHFISFFFTGSINAPPPSRQGLLYGRGTPSVWAVSSPTASRESASLRLPIMHPRTDLLSHGKDQKEGRGGGDLLPPFWVTLGAGGREEVRPLRPKGSPGFARAPTAASSSLVAGSRRCSVGHHPRDLIEFDSIPLHPRARFCSQRLNGRSGGRRRPPVSQSPLLVPK